jgi:hypothetical protein
MKKMIVLTALVLAPMATMAADNVCVGDPTKAAPVTITAGNFVKVAFTPTCSVDTLVQVDQDQVKLWGASASLKGKKYFSGSTAGGAIVPVADCAASTGCTAATDIAAGMTAAAKMGGTGTGTGT